MPAGKDAILALAGKFLMLASLRPLTDQTRIAEDGTVACEGPSWLQARPLGAWLCQHKRWAVNQDKSHDASWPPDESLWLVSALCCGRSKSGFAACVEYGRNLDSSVAGEAE